MEGIRTVGVVGCGSMGSGIAQLAAVNGLEVWLHDSDSAALSKAHGSISSRIQSMISKGRLSKEKGAESVRNLNCTSKLEDFSSVDIVIEAIVESEEVKKALFARLDKILKASAILASNTSSISITRLASATTRPAQVIGMHFMNPPPIMKLVEIIRGASTSDDTFNATKFLAERLGKKIVCSRDFSGFIVNRILMPMINEAFQALHTGVATKEDIDTGMKLGTNHPMGPLELADHIGLDVCLSIMRVLHSGLGDSKYAPSPLLVQYVDAGRLGRKNGVGVYNFIYSAHTAVLGLGFSCHRYQADNLGMKFLFQSPCCSCFCFIKPNRGKPRNEEAADSNLTSATRGRWKNVIPTATPRRRTAPC